MSKKTVRNAKIDQQSNMGKEIIGKDIDAHYVVTYLKTNIENHLENCGRNIQKESKLMPS